MLHMRQVALIMCGPRRLDREGHNLTGDYIERDLNGAHWARAYAYLHQSVLRGADGVQVGDSVRLVCRPHPVPWAPG
jgi:hypothetical protein